MDLAAAVLVDLADNLAVEVIVLLSVLLKV